MSTKLIQTTDYLLLIDEEAEIKEGNYYLTYLGNVYQETKRPFEEDEGVERFTNRNSYKCILAYYPLTEKELDLPLLPPFEDDVEEEFKKIVWSTKHPSRFQASGQDKAYKDGFIKGYKAAQSNKQFSLEDMKKAIDMARTGYGYDGDIDVVAHLDMGGIDNYDNEFKFKLKEEIIQSLSTQQLPKEFIPDEKSIEDINKELNIYGHDEGLTESEYQDYIKSNSLMKSITNSEGKEELVGTYKY